MAYNKFWQPQPPQQPEIQQSQFNEAAQKVFRLHLHQIHCTALWRKGDFENLSFELDAVWVELVSDTTSNQRKKFNKINDQIDAAISVQNQQPTLRKRDFVRKRLSELVKKKWMFIFFIKKAQGLDKKYKEGGDDLF